MGEIIRLSQKNFDEAIKKTANVLENDGVAVLPTETVYGLFTLYGNGKGVRRIFEIKRRPEEKAIALTLSDVSEIGKYAMINDRKRKILERLLPGPLTIVMTAEKGVHTTAISKEDTVGIRIPDYDFTLNVIKYLKIPLLSTSANTSGLVAPANFSEIEPPIIQEADITVDAGACPLGVASTVIDFRKEDLILLRKGVLPEEKIRKIFAEFHE